MTTTVAEVHAEILSTEESPFMSHAELAERYPDTLPENARVWDSWPNMRSAVAASGSHFFDADAIRHFRGKSDMTLYAGRFWVESRKYVNTFSGDSSPREYMVAWASGREGEFLSIERLGNYPTLARARRACRILAAAVENAGE